jgi:hypothetical protein
LASGMRVVVEIVWNVWITVVFDPSSSSGSSLMTGLGLSGSSFVLWVGLCGESNRESSEVLASEIIAGAGGSQDGVLA